MQTLHFLSALFLLAPKLNAKDVLVRSIENFLYKVLLSILLNFVTEEDAIKGENAAKRRSISKRSETVSRPFRRKQNSLENSKIPDRRRNESSLSRTRDAESRN